MPCGIILCSIHSLFALYFHHNYVHVSKVQNEATINKIQFTVKSSTSGKIIHFLDFSRSLPVRELHFYNSKDSDHKVSSFTLYSFHDDYFFISTLLLWPLSQFHPSLQTDNWSVITSPAKYKSGMARQTSDESVISKKNLR